MIVCMRVPVCAYVIFFLIDTCRQDLMNTSTRAQTRIHLNEHAKPFPSEASISWPAPEPKQQPQRRRQGLRACDLPPEKSLWPINETDNHIVNIIWGEVDGSEICVLRRLTREEF